MVFVLFGGKLSVYVLSCVLTTWYDLLLRHWSDHRRGFPTTISLIIITDKWVLTSSSAKPSLLNAWVDTRGRLLCNLHGPLIYTDGKSVSQWVMHRYGIEFDCCTEGCTCWGDAVIHWGSYSPLWFLLHSRVYLLGYTVIFQ